MLCAWELGQQTAVDPSSACSEEMSEPSRRGLCTKEEERQRTNPLDDPEGDALQEEDPEEGHWRAYPLDAEEQQVPVDAAEETPMEASPEREGEAKEDKGESIWNPRFRKCIKLLLASISNHEATPIVWHISDGFQIQIGRASCRERV